MQYFEKIIAQILQPLVERRDYSQKGKDSLEQNADILRKKKQLPEQLNIAFKNRNKDSASYLEQTQKQNKYRHMDITNNASNVAQDILAVIKRCPKKDVIDDRPKSQQQWCLYTRDESRLLGRHPSKDKALKQEQVIQIHKHIN